MIAHGTCLNARRRFLKKHQNAPRPSEHPPVMGEKKSKRFVLADSEYPCMIIMEIIVY